MSAELDDLEWEEWNPKEISFVGHMLAGSFAGPILTLLHFTLFYFTLLYFAGVAEHVSIFPFDTLKTHMQCDRCVTG